MRQFLLTLTGILLFTGIGLGQVEQIIYKKYDYIKKETNPLFGKKSASIEFNLISLTNLMNDSTTYGVEAYVNVRKQEVVGTSSSIAFSNIGSLLSSSVSGSSLSKIINKEGFIFLDRDNLKTIEDFINRALAARGKKQENYIMYKLTLNERLEVGLKYDPEKNADSKWDFIITINKATYVTPYNDGLELLRKLNDFRERLIELEA
mgnify:CR=1 FL=1